MEAVPISPQNPQREAAHHAVLLIIIILLCLCPARPAQAQFNPIWTVVDTVTSGPFDDINPVVVHNSDWGSWYAPEEWNVIFERHSAGESQIASVGYDFAAGKWDSSVRIVSSVRTPQEQVHPDYAALSYVTEYKSHVARLAAWQRKASDRWQIYYSFLIDSQASWTPPTLLVADTLDNTAVQVRSLSSSDSLFLVTWKRANTLEALVISPSGAVTQPAPLVTGEPELMDYDIAVSWGQIKLVWISGSADSPAVYAGFLYTSFPLQIVVEDTLLTNIPVSKPRLFSPWYGPWILLESRASGKPDVVVCEKNDFLRLESVTDDTLAENLNASAISYPKITKIDVSVPSAWVYFDACAYEKYRGTDSMLVFLPNYGLEDTIRTPGHNRNAVVGSQVVRGGIPVVWESNRTGRSHIYGRRAKYISGDVAEDHAVPSSFRLYQNYPNPFNPTTTIRYTVGGVVAPSGAFSSGVEPFESPQGSTLSPPKGRVEWVEGPAARNVRLVVYDVLGRQVATLVNEQQAPGSYQVRFDGSGLASGVYLYRMTAGNFVQSRKMILVK